MEPAVSGEGGRSDRGMALVAAMMSALLMLTLGSALVLITTTETRIGSRYARGAEVLAAAETFLDRATLELQALGEWDLALGGVLPSTSIDGAPAGPRTVADVSVDLDAATSWHRCGRPSCSEADLVSFTAERPWGVNNPRWQLFAWGPLGSAVTAVTGGVSIYVLVWVADDPGENDGDPLRDGATDENPGRDTLLVMAEAHGGGGLRRTLHATIRRLRDPETEEPAGLEVLAWREVR
jgi:hypothetical protein